MTRSKILLKLIVLFVSVNLFIKVAAQVKKPLSYPVLQNRVALSAECGTDNLLNHLRQDPQYRLKEARMNREILSAQRTLSDSILILPVVFHIINQDPQSISDQKILDALKDLNDAFSKSGQYADSKGADTKIRFCLAQQDPDGGNTTGITRTKSFLSDNQNPAIEDYKLKNLIQWDPSQYINIWFINSISEEEYATYICGQWSRISKHAYATMPPASGPLDGIVVTQFYYMLAHEMGHYLGLYHTFEGNNCANNDCTTDGDKVCDTPPNTFVSDNNLCGTQVNSCSTDSLSGFTQDVHDLVEDFMDYGNATCANEFTQGQADRMRAAIETQRAGLLQPKCAKPCNENISAGFTRDNANPVPGNVVHFTNISNGGANFQWLVNDVVVATDKDFSYTFTANGKYKVSLKSFNTISCFATYTDYVIVTCGVSARFYADKQFLASKTSVLVDSVHFTNTSENASNYQWIVSSNAGMSSQVVSTAKDFTYGFPEPATYLVQLIAGNGGCSDTTGQYTVIVDDPTPDGVIRIHSVSCYQKTKLQLKFFICNNGYAPIPANIPVSFYDADPRLGNAHKLGSSFYISDAIAGHCCGPQYTTIIDARAPGINQIFVVFNDSGYTMPLQLPNTPFIEKDYTNNLLSASNFQFTVSATPGEAVLEPGDTLQLSAQGSPDSVSSYIWGDAHLLTCTRCQATSLIADSNRIKTIIANSNLGCADTDYVIIKVPPANDYTISIDSVDCAANDSLNVQFTIYNSFKRGIIPKDLTVSFYNGNPAGGNALLLKPLFKVLKLVNEKKASFSTRIKGISQGSFYAVVNDNGAGVPDTLAFPEKDYTNNDTSILYTPDSVSIQPSDTTIIRKGTVLLSISSPVFDPATTTWFAGTGNAISCTNCSNTVATVFNNSTVTVQTTNRYGCFIKGNANIKISPPDFTIKLINSECYTNNTTQVTFQICTGNNYDSIYANLPVSFYDNQPFVSKANTLYPVFYTPELTPGTCNTFTHKVATPSSGKLYAVVNDKGENATAPDNQYDETDYTNNISLIKTEPFRVTVTPNDTTLAQLGSLTLFATVTGGTVSSYVWSVLPSISCTNCAAAVVRPSYTTRYNLSVRNNNFCTDTTSALVKIFTTGSVNIPSAFSPNADGLNDVFYVLAGRDVSLIKDFTIYNRWGQKIFQSTNSLPNDPTPGWNGTFGGQPSAPGTYVYVATVTFADGKQQIFKGTVVLVR